MLGAASVTTRSRAWWVRVVAEWKPGARVWSASHSKAGTVLPNQAGDDPFSVKVRLDGEPHAVHLKPLTIAPLPEPTPTDGDPVASPSHYTRGSIETIDYIEDKSLGYHLGNAVKYVSRAGHKDPDKTVEDLRKAVWYIEREIKRLSS